jgi:hypothetical protein
VFCSNGQTDKKNVPTVQSVWMLTWQSHMTHGRAELAGSYNMWQVLVGSWTMNHFLTRGLFVVNGMATHGPINGRHMSPRLGLKLMKSTGLDPVTSGARGRALGRVTQPMCPHMILNIYMVFNLFKLHVF